VLEADVSMDHKGFVERIVQLANPHTVESTTQPNSLRCASLELTAYPQATSTRCILTL
jgi:hypothetical protein